MMYEWREVEKEFGREFMVLRIFRLPFFFAPYGRNFLLKYSVKWKSSCCYDS